MYDGPKDQSFPYLTAGQRERLSMLIEECGEVITAATKVLRHGYDNHHPDRPGRTNQDDLSDEILDVLAVADAMRRTEDLPIDSRVCAVHNRWQKKLKYTHHQPTPGRQY